ncbi:hypothetical protein PS880_05017 [Pseudomonas fluorescens]|uniref:Uncharacterized protein n=1 Tax=Pseudomonas fluorescens TaxID=294 RepID=A0A5E7PAE0_PSEFL|nr:hypothetical protein PS880_05017 [Pseudomonas fluorescens]
MTRYTYRTILSEFCVHPSLGSSAPGTKIYVFLHIYVVTNKLKLVDSKAARVILIKNALE